MEQSIFSKSTGGVALTSTAVSTAGAQTSAIWIDTLGYETADLLLYVSAYASGSISGVSFNGSNIAAHTDSVAIDDHFTEYYPSIFPITATGVYHIASVAKYRYIQLVVTTANPTVSMTISAYYFLSMAWSNPPIVQSSDLILAQIGGYTVEGDTNSTTPKR